MKATMTFVSLVCFATSAFAASGPSVTPPATTLNANVTSTTLLPSVAAPVVGPFKLTAGFKSQNTQGRNYEISSKDGRTYKMKNEFYAGAVHTSGWGLSAMGVQAGESFGEATKDHPETRYGVGDPSITLIHPKVYDDGDLKISGQLRRYFPATTRSLDRHQEQYAYYSFASYTMPRGLSLFNQLTPRYFAQSYYKPTDSNYFIEDYTSLTQKVNSWFKYGVGQHSQIEWHKDTKSGSVAEIYPLVDFVFSNNIFIEPRVYLPVYRNDGAVYDSPKAVSLSNSQFEIYMQVSI